MAAEGKVKSVHRPDDPFAWDSNHCRTTEEGNYATCVTCGRELPLDLTHWFQKDINSFDYRLGLRGPVEFRGEFAQRPCRKCFLRKLDRDWCTICGDELFCDTPSRQGNLSRAQKTKHCHGQRKCKCCAGTALPDAPTVPCSSCMRGVPEHASAASSSMAHARDDVKPAKVAKIDAAETQELERGNVATHP